MMFMFLFITILFIFIMTFKHLLTSLILLEFLTLILFYLLVSLFPLLENEIFCALFYLAIAACEGALGLSLITQWVRCQGNDMMSTS